MSDWDGLGFKHGYEAMEYCLGCMMGRSSSSTSIGGLVDLKSSRTFDIESLYGI